MRLVFIAGPYTKGDVAVNVKLALDAADKLMEAGAAVFVPHLSHFQHMAHPRQYEDWTANDNAILSRCDALFRMLGESQGADAEIALAETLDLPVFHTWTALMLWLWGPEEEL